MAYSWQKEIILPGNLYPYLTAEDHYWTASITISCQLGTVKGLKVNAYFPFLKPQNVTNWKMNINISHLLNVFVRVCLTE